MPSIDPSKLQVVPTELPALKIPDSLNYRKVCGIRIPSKDIFFKWCLPELLAAISAETLAEIHKIWDERNIIDVAIKGEIAAMDLSQNLAEILRWHLRGMSVDLSVWKVRDAVTELGSVGSISEVFIGFQEYLYARDKAA